MRARPEWPAYESLAAVPTPVLFGLIEEHAGRAIASAEDQAPWRRDWLRWHAVRSAAIEAATGAVPQRSASQPRWLGSLVRSQLAALGQSSRMRDVFEGIRLLERLGVVAPDVDDTYALAMVSGLGTVGPAAKRADLLVRDPVLLDRAWLMFRVEGGGEVSLANADKYWRTGEGWVDTFLELIEKGGISRSRLLTECLCALQRDFSSYRAGWFSRMYLRLEPTIDEVKVDESRLLALVASDVTATVSLAIGELLRLSGADRLEDASFSALAPSMYSRTKGTPIDALRLLKQLAGRNPQLHAKVADVAARGLVHPNAEVQAAAARLVRDLGAAHLIHGLGADLAPTVQREFGLVAVAHADVAPDVPPRTKTTVVNGSPVGRIGGVELVERIARLLEDASDPLAVELGLAALAACHEPEQLKPLATRARQILQRGPRIDLTPTFLRAQFARLVLTAVGEPMEPGERPGPRVNFLLDRIDAVEGVLDGSRVPHVLLATPTDSAGWLDPRDFANRVSNRHDEPNEADLVAALLRLAPTGRGEALSMIGASDERSLAMRHALGAPAPVPTAITTAMPNVWAAASRTRDPTAIDDVLVDAGLAAAGEGRPVVANVVPHARPLSYTGNDGKEHRSVHWQFAVEVEHGDRVDPGQPGQAVTGDQSNVFRRYPSLGKWDLEDWIDWMLFETPHDIEAPLVDLIGPVLSATAGFGVEHDATRVLSGLLRHPGAIGALGRSALAVGMAIARPDQRVLAIDAVAAYVTTGRLSPQEFAAAMASLAPAVQLTRWAASLRSLAQATGSRFVIELLTVLLPDVAPESRGLNSLLELLLDEQIRTSIPVSREVLRTWLAGLSRTGRSGRAAALLELE